MFNLGIGLTKDNSNSHKDSYTNCINNIHDNLKCGIYDNSNIFTKITYFPKEYTNVLSKSQSHLTSSETTFQNEGNVEFENSILDESINEIVDKVMMTDQEGNSILPDSEEELNEYQEIHSGSMTIENYKVNFNDDICKFYDIDIKESNVIDCCLLEHNIEDKNNIVDYIENEESDNADNVLNKGYIEIKETNDSNDDLNDNLSGSEESDKLNEISTKTIEINKEIETVNENSVDTKENDIEINNLNKTNKINNEQGNELIGNKTKNPIVTLLSKYLSCKYSL